jgi:hypothetical protein
LVALPSTETAGVNDTILTSNNVDIVATETITLAAANLNADFTDNASIQAPSVDITASAGDVVIASGNNLTLTVKNDRIVVDGDIDLTGQINAASTTIIETSTTTIIISIYRTGSTSKSLEDRWVHKRRLRIATARRCFVYLRCIVDTYYANSNLQMPVAELSTLTTSSIALSTLGLIRSFIKVFCSTSETVTVQVASKRKYLALKNRIGKHLAVRYVSHV